MWGVRRSLGKVDRNVFFCPHPQGCYDDVEELSPWGKGLEGGRELQEGFSLTLLEKGRGGLE